MANIDYKRIKSGKDGNFLAKEMKIMNKTQVYCNEVNKNNVFQINELEKEVKYFNQRISEIRFSNINTNSKENLIEIYKKLIKIKTDEIEKLRNNLIIC